MIHRSLAGLACLVVFLGAGIAQEKDRPPSKAPLARVDLFGDPLPGRVLARMGSVRLDCEDSIWSAVFAADGKSLSVMTLAREKQLWLLDVATGKTVRRSSLPEGSREYARTPD